MNFDDIKNSLDNDEDGFEIPSSINDLSQSKLPIETIRKSMKGEIASQLAIIVIFYAVLFLIDFTPLAFSVYTIFITITCVFTMIYLFKLMKFVSKTSHISLNTRASIFAFIYDLKLTLEVYKTAIIAGSIMLPFPMAALCLGRDLAENKDYFEKLFLFQGTMTETIATVVIFFLCVAVFYYITLWWTEHMYGKHITAVEEILEDLGE